MSIYHVFNKKRKIAGLVLAILGIFFFTAATKHKPTAQAIPSAQSSYDVIIFDLGNVLFSTKPSAKNKLIATTLLKNPALLYYLIYFDVKTEYFNFLHSVPASGKNIIFHESKPMPAIMADWQTGLSNGNEIIATITAHLPTTNHPIAVQNLFAAIASFMFTAQTLADCQQPIPCMVHMAQALKNAGYKLFVLSNWDELSFALVQKQHEQIFNLFDGILISGQEKIAKPNQEFFQRLFSKFNINPTTSIFIDDEPANLEAAQELGLSVILCDKPASVTQGLINLGVVKYTS
ncbi:hypothetical protein A3J41_01120 [candidate division TM6 bacterium RIFCSPHIGHO2_12_FULL_38_8]|nr:MAG: hypothetical protein A3J41_01120 [candidate division TM6 bacterium RIFCSPHIGHO2_12_FULL_38_8]